MTFALALPTVASTIAGLTITGITIVDTNKISSSWLSQPNILYPNPINEGFITGFSIAYERYIDGTISPVQASYVLHYRFLGSQIGDLSNFSSAYGDIAAKLATIVNAIVQACGSVTDVYIELGEVTIGNKIDPSGNQYHGADFALNVTEVYKN